MRILIDIGHPAHVHLFRFFAKEMIERGNQVLFTCREKEFEKELLEGYGFQFVSFGKKYKSMIGKLWGLLKFDYKEWKTCLRFKPDILLSHGSMYAAHAAWLIRKSHISFEDTFNMEQVNLYKPFTKVVLTGDYDNPLMRDPKTIQYAGYHELAYLHPNNFTPDKSILKEIGVKEGEQYIVIRFVSWNATHDVGVKGFSIDDKIKLVQSLEKHCRVFISSEKSVPLELEKNVLRIHPSQFHSLLGFAALYIGEGATTASEAAVIGVPAIYTNVLKTNYCNDEEQYGLLYQMTDCNTVIDKSIEILNQPQEVYTERKNHFLAEKIDVTAFLVWFIEHYPDSAKMMRENPDFQHRFK